MKRFLAVLLTFGLGVQVLASGTYSTSFPATENPISESSNWVNGSSASASWGNVRTTTNEAFGVSLPTTFGDPTAILAGSWGSNQSGTATVKVTSQPNVCCHEVEVRLLTTIAANSITGYELLMSAAAGSPYIQLIRWNGANGSFDQLDQLTPAREARNGDVIIAAVTQSGGTKTFSFTLNGVAQTFTNCSCTSPTDSGGSSFSTGAPGIGFYDNQDSNWSFFGFSAFSATDGSVVPNPPSSNPGRMRFLRRGGHE